MLQDLLKAFTGSATTTAFTNPAGFGINNVPPQATFQNFFNSLSTSLNNTPQAGFGGLPQGFGGGTSPGAIQAYRNTQGQFPGISAGYMNPFESNNHKKLIKAQALAPGAVEIDNLMQPPVQQGSNLMPGVAAQLASLGGPLQGSTFQNNPTPGAPQGGFGVPQGGFSAPFGQGQFPVGPSMFPQGQGGFGKIQFLLAPIIGLFSLVKSLFGFRRFASSLKPIKVDKNNLGFYNYQDSYNNFDRHEGSFDDYNPEVETQNLEAEKLEAY